MNERTPQSYERSIRNDGLRMLDAQFRYLERASSDTFVTREDQGQPASAPSGHDNDPHTTYALIDRAIQDYLYAELGLDGKQAAGVVECMHQQGMLPSVYESDEEPTWAVQVARLAVFTELGSLYMNSVTTEQFTEWLPDALKVAAPTDGRHDQACASDESACHDRHCPVRRIRWMIEDAALTPDYTQYSYEVDEDRARTNLRSLLVATYDHGLIDETAWRSLDDYYVVQYALTFVTNR